jgi:hypothetical protein
MLTATLVSVPKKQIRIFMKPLKIISRSSTNNFVSAWCRSQGKKTKSKQNVCGVVVFELYRKPSLYKGTDRSFLEQAKEKIPHFPIDEG